MNTKRRLLAAILAATAAYPAKAQGTAASALSSVTVTATASVVSQYMFRGQRLSSGALQPSVEFGSGDFVGGIWANVPFDGDKVPGSSDPEIDLYGAYTIKLSDVASVVPGFTSYHFPKAPESAGFYRWTFEPNVAFNYSARGFRLTPKIYYDTVLKGATLEFTALYALPLTAVGSELDFVATAGTYTLRDFANDATPSVKAWGDYWLVGVWMPFQINGTSKLTVGFAFTEGRGAYTKAGSSPRAPNSLAVGRGVASISYGWSF